MNKMKRALLLMALVLSMAMALTACKPAEEKQETTEKQETEQVETESKDEVTLADWEGTWNNMGAYLDQVDVQEGFEKLAKKEGKSVEEAKRDYFAKRKCDFDGMVIEGNKATLLDGFADKDGKAIETVEYEFVEIHKAKHGNHDLEWNVFKASGDAKYPILLMMSVHGEESLTHFHMRYGSDVKELLETEGWFPTFVKPSTTSEQLIDEIAE